MNAEFLAMLGTHRVLGIIRGSGSEEAVVAGQALVAAGITTLEVSLTTPGALDAINLLARVPGCHVGAGTVLTTADVAAVVDAGAGFIVTPAVCEAIAAGAAAHVPVIGGAQTASESLAALREGAAAVKLFPASVGGPAFLKALRDPFPGIPFVPVGGVDLASAREYLALGAIAVGVGGPLVGDAARGGSLEELARRAAAYVALAAEFLPS